MLLSEKARLIAPYVAGEQPQDKSYIKLNTNENPYPPSGKVKEAIAGLNLNALRLYPDPDSLSLCKAIAESEGVPEGYVFCGNGSDEVLALAFAAFFSAGEKPVVFPDITYSFYPVFCGLFGLSFMTPALNLDFTVNLSDYVGRDGKAAGIVLANPNAPTSLALPLGAVEEIIASNPQIVVLIDEAYAAFCGYTAAQLTLKYKNAAVVKTFSKSYSLAGLRCGYCVAQPELIEGLKKIKESFNSYPLDRLAQVAAAAAVRDTEYLKATSKKIIKTRDATKLALEKMGFTVLNSASNFLFITSPEIGGRELYLGLKERGVLVRHFDKPRIKDFVRVSIGTNADMRVFLEKIEELLK